MQYALVNTEKMEATPDLNGQGLCPGCLQPVTAICGDQRIWHWRHRTKKTCDRWWETETQWHRDWKNNFPSEWREDIKYDSNTGEKHIADVRTPHGLVIEFQNSRIDPLERAVRERFYGNMVWVVNGTRLKNDFPRFVKGQYLRQFMNNVEFFLVPCPEKCFPASWLQSVAPVIFDFRDVAAIDSSDVRREHLWCLFPGRAEGYAVLAALSRQSFVTEVSSTAQPFPGHEVVTAIAQQIRQQRIKRTMPMTWQRMPLRRTRRL